MECETCNKEVRNFYRDEIDGKHVNLCKTCHDVAGSGGVPKLTYLTRIYRAWRWLHRCVRDITLTNSGGTWTAEFGGRSESGEKLLEVIERMMENEMSEMRRENQPGLRRMPADPSGSDGIPDGE